MRSAGEPGFEPGFTVLETVRMAVISLPRRGLSLALALAVPPALRAAFAT